MSSPRTKVVGASKAIGRGRAGGKKGRKDARATEGAQGGKQRKKPSAPKGQSQSCHQCRQSIHSSKGVSEVKSGKERLKCSRCTRYWCEQCLQNRYGVVRTALDPGLWACPVCEGKCNCSLCRKKAGKLATGILTPLIKTAGYDSVSDFLDKSTDDIAKCLQWSAPTGTVSPAIRPSANAKAPTQKSRKRKRSHADKEQDPTCMMDSPPLPVTTPLPSPPEAPTGANETTPPSPRPSAKRRRLSHSRYCITVEEDDPLITRATKGQQAKVDEGIDSTTRHDQTPEPVQQDNQVKQESPKSQEPSPTTVLRRSSRRKRQTQKFFTPPAKVGLPRVRNGRRESPKKQRQVEDHDKLLEEKKGTLESLRSAQMGSLRSRKMEEQLKKTEGRARARQARREQLEKENEEKEREREARNTAKRKLRLAQGILKEAQRERARRQREGERQRKQEQLERFKEQRKAERKKRNDLLSLPLTGSLDHGLVSDNDVLCGLAELPPLPELGLGVAEKAVPRLLFVAEFLCSFAEPLNLKKQWRADELCTLLSNGRGLSEVYLSLLQSVTTGDDHIRKVLKPNKRQRDLETMAVEYLHREGRNGFASGGVGAASLPVEDGLLVLEHLCLQALESDAIRECMEEARERGEEVRREGRTQEREKTKAIGAGLKEMCDNGCSLEDIEERREEVVKELAQMRAASDCEQYKCGLAVRNQFLGTDRHGRLYWRLQSVAGLVVEETACGDLGLIGEEGGCEDQGVERGGRTRWRTVNSEDLLRELMASPMPAENPLLQSLRTHLPDILTSMKAGKRDAAVKKFYGQS